MKFKVMVSLFVVLILVPAFFAKGPQRYVGFPSQIQANNEENLSNCDSVKITKLGCFSDYMHTPRPLPELILTDRDPHSSLSDGHVFDWEKPTQSMQDLACRCAKRVINKKYSVFSLQFFGECWSGERTASTYSDDGPSKSCLGKEYKPCHDESGTPCTGVDFSNYVFKAEIAPTQAAPTADPNCVDKYPICEHYASIKLCTNKFPLVLKYCLKSCKLC